MNRQRWIAVATGAVVGFLSSHVLLIGWGNLIFWGLAGAVIGFFVRGRREVIYSGAAFGFFLSISFLFSGFQGAHDKIAVFALFSLGLSIFGMAGGIVAVFIGSWLRKKFA